MYLKCLIGIDLGTTLAKCVIYDEIGRVVAGAHKEMKINYPKAGEAEQDAHEFYTISCELIKKCLRESKIDPKSVIGISIDSQMGGIMAIDRNFNPVTYYDTPLDSRSATENEYIHKNFGDLILEKNGSFSTYGNKILYWKKRKEWKEIYKFIQPSAYVAGKLAGLSSSNAFIDQSFLCFSGLSDLKKSEWSDELCDKLQIDISKLPKIVKSTDIIGETTSASSADTGLPKGIPICAGCGDQAAGFIGAGVFEPGSMIDVSGTACILGACIDEYKYDSKNKTLACMKSAIGEKYYLISVVLGGKTHKWFVDEFFSNEKKEQEKAGNDIYEFLDDMAKKLPPGSDGLIAIDYLQGRFFPPDPNVRGLFVGHTWAHKKIHFYRSILESIAYDHYLTKNIIKSLVPKLNLTKVTAIGSGAKSKLWMQIKSDILQIPYQNLCRSDLSTLGSAIIAGYATGMFNNLDNISKNIVRKNIEIKPRPGEDKKYKKYIKIYKNLLLNFKDIYKEIREAQL